MQEIVELVVFGLIALLVGTGVLWLLGWLIGLVGSLFMWLAGILWLLLRWIIPVVVILAAVYALFRLLQRQNKRRSDTLKRGPVVSGVRSSDGPGTDAASSPAPDSSPPSSFPPSVVAGRPAGYTPAAAPITTPVVSASGEPVSPLSSAPAVKPVAAEPVMASGEPVSSLEETAAPVESTVIESSAEPVAVEVVDAEPVAPADAETPESSTDTSEKKKK